MHRLQLDWGGPSVTLQGVFVEVHSLGLLLAGSSGAGKSEVALDLVSRGHRLIADDVVDVIHPVPGILVGRCPPLLGDFMEVRGLGLLNVRRLYGDDAIAPLQRLDLIVHLDNRPDAPAEEAAARLAGRRGVRDVLGVAVPEIFLRARLGHNQRALVEAACRDHWLRLSGYRSDEDFGARQQAAVLRDRS